MTNNNLVKCPFCGNDDLELNIDCASIFCHECRTQKSGDSPDKVVEEWNSRALTYPGVKDE